MLLPHRQFDFLTRPGRRGVSMLWLLLAFPALILFLVLVVEIGNIWLARLELEQSLEANALAAVKEWAEGGVTDTKNARIVGNQFTIANPVRFKTISLTDNTLNTAFVPAADPDLLNYDSTKTNPNDNKVCTDITDYNNYMQSGVLVFGAITQINGATPDTSVIFNAAAPATCSSGNVLVDATGKGNLSNGFSNNWGVSYYATTQSLSNNLTITKIEIDVDPALTYNTGTVTDYVFHQSTAETSTAGSGNYAISYSTGPHNVIEQIDNFYYEDVNNAASTRTINEVYTFPNAHVMSITFAGASDSINALKPGERFRFGAEVHEGSENGNQVDGDGVAQVVEIRIYYSNNTVVKGVLIDDHTKSANGPCRKRAEDRDAAGPVTDARGVVHIEPHELPIQDLPCPADSGDNGQGNGQSWGLIGGSTGPVNYYAVRAQATIGVPSVVKQICGFNLGPWGVSAKATAYYDCLNQDPKLIRVDVFRCTYPYP
ncbi:hypothetical protein GC197_01295 [bacterium]|nr:hypothetical protein [bacterium]